MAIFLSSVKIYLFELKLLQVFFLIYLISLSPKICYIFVKNRKSCEEKLFFGHFEMLTILSDILEHALLQGTHKLTVLDETKSQIPKAPGTVPCGPLSHNRFIYMQLPHHCLALLAKTSWHGPFM